MKKRFILTLLVGLVMATTACSSGDNDKVSVAANASADATEKIETEPQTESVSEVGKRSNPIPLGQTATFSNDYYSNNGETIEATISVTLSNVVRGEEAYSYLIGVNQFNEAAPDGYEWIVFDATLTLDKGSVDDAYYVMPSLKIIDSSGSEVNQSDYATFATGEEFGYVDIYEGGQSSGKVGKLVPVGSDVLVEFSDWNSSVFFTLQ